MSIGDGRTSLGSSAGQTSGAIADIAQLHRIEACLRAALKIADERADPLLGVKLYDCIAHVEEAIRTSASRSAG